MVVFFFQAEDGIRDLVRSRGLGDVYKRQGQHRIRDGADAQLQGRAVLDPIGGQRTDDRLSLIHI